MPRPRPLSFSLASPADAPALAALHTSVNIHLAKLHNQPPRDPTTEKNILFNLRNARIYLVHQSDQLIATFRLTTKKPWAIDKTYFTKCAKPLYLTAMAVAPDQQRQGVGTRCLNHAAQIAREWPADAIRLDAHDGVSGAGPFYARNGYTERGRATYRTSPLIYYELLLGPAKLEK